MVKKIEKNCKQTYFFRPQGNQCSLILEVGHQHGGIDPVSGGVIEDSATLQDSPTEGVKGHG